MGFKMQLRAPKAIILFKRYEQFDKEINEMLLFLKDEYSKLEAKPYFIISIRLKMNLLFDLLEGFYTESLVYLDATKNMIQRSVNARKNQINEIPTTIYEKDYVLLVSRFRQLQQQFGSAIAEELETLEIAFQAKSTIPSQMKAPKSTILFRFYEQLDGELKEMISFLNSHFLNQSNNLEEGITVIQKRMKLLANHLEKFEHEVLNNLISRSSSQEKIKKLLGSLTYHHDTVPTLCKPNSFPTLISIHREIQLRLGILIAEELELLELSYQKKLDSNPSAQTQPAYPGFLSNQP